MHPTTIKEIPSILLPQSQSLYSHPLVCTICITKTRNGITVEETIGWRERLMRKSEIWVTDIPTSVTNCRNISCTNCVMPSDKRVQSRHCHQMPSWNGCTNVYHGPAYLQMLRTTNILRFSSTSLSRLRTLFPRPYLSTVYTIRPPLLLSSRTLSTSPRRCRSEDETSSTSPRKPSIRENIYTIPNLLTSSRILACPILGWSILADNYHLATGLLVYAGLTDLVGKPTYFHSFPI